MQVKDLDNIVSLKNLILDKATHTYLKQSFQLHATA